MFKKPVALLVGNGINNSKEVGLSWSALLEKIGNSVGQKDIQEKLSNPFRPFPILLENIVLKAPGDYENNLRTVKMKIASLFKDLNTTPLHQKIMNLESVSEIMTTNYDYTLENASISNFATSNYEISETKEWVHSLRRKRTISDKNIWHIHGELYSTQEKKNSSLSRYREKSILIGFEQYADYLRKVRGRLVLRNKDNMNFYNRLRSSTEESWVKLFFTHDLHIMGLSLDISETHLWSILNFRARNKSNPSVTNLNDNSITFYQFMPSVTVSKKDNPDKIRKNANSLDRYNAIKEMLESMDIKIVRKEFSTNQEAIDLYHKYLDEIEGNLT